MDDTLPAAGAGYDGTRSGAGTGSASAVAGALADLTAARAPSLGTVGPLVTALAVALDHDATEGPYAAAETELTGRLPGTDDRDLRALMLAGAGVARALRWSGRQDATLWPGVLELFDRAAADLGAPEPSESWLAACLPLFAAQLSLTVRTGDPRTARTAARLAGVLGNLLDRRPGLAAAMAGTVATGVGQIGGPGAGVAIREALANAGAAAAHDGCAVLVVASRHAVHRRRAVRRRRADVRPLAAGAADLSTAGIAGSR